MKMFVCGAEIAGLLVVSIVLGFSAFVELDGIAVGNDVVAVVIGLVNAAEKTDVVEGNGFSVLVVVIVDGVITGGAIVMDGTAGGTYAPFDCKNDEEFETCVFAVDAGIDSRFSYKCGAFKYGIA